MFLKCVAGGNPTPEISWELDSKKISNSERYQVGQYVTVNGDVVSYLNITSIHANDGGLYKCIASSKVGTAEHSAKLNVYGLPYIRPMEKKAIVAGENLVITCPVAGYPIESIVWERGIYKQREHILSVSVLFLFNSRKSCITNKSKTKSVSKWNINHRKC